MHPKWGLIFHIAALRNTFERHHVKKRSVSRAKLRASRVKTTWRPGLARAPDLVILERPSHQI
jgi:hypothetical protein